MPLSQSSTTASVAEPSPQEPRTYAITGGRTRVRYELHLETQLMPGTASAQPVSAEARQVVAACGRRSVSVAEIAAAIRRPVWAAKVLIGDLLDTGALIAPPSASNPGSDPAVLRHILARLRQA
ncbi:DUF742 domain-containing protein [Streptomyces sp. NBC_00433]